MTTICSNSNVDDDCDSGGGKNRTSSGWTPNAVLCSSASVRLVYSNIIELDNDSTLASMEATTAYEQVGSEEDLIFPEEEWYEQVLRYGLYLGAAFQIICILAVIISPSTDLKDDLNVI